MGTKIKDFSGTFPRAGIMQNGVIFNRNPLVRITRVRNKWATPAAADCVGSTGGGQGRSLRTDIHNWKKNWPTPTATGCKAGPDFARKNRKGSGGDSLPTAVARVEERKGQLNPGFVEWLMGFPLNWTVLMEE